MATQWADVCTQIKWIKVSDSTIFTKCISIFYISPFLISLALLDSFRTTVTNDMPQKRYRAELGGNDYFYLRAALG